MYRTDALLLDTIWTPAHLGDQKADSLLGLEALCETETLCFKFKKDLTSALSKKNGD